MARDREALARAVSAELARRGWNRADALRATKLDPDTLRSTLEARRWPQPKTQGALEKGLDWPPGTVDAIGRGERPPPVGGHPQDAFVPAPGARLEEGTVSNALILEELRALRREVDELKRQR